jgi:hypothetical protein
VSNFSFLSKKTSAVESSSHAPSRASGRLSRGAAHFFYRRDVDRMKEDLQKADRVQVFVGGMIGLMEISASMETTRIRDSLVSLRGGRRGWNANARSSLLMVGCAVRRYE